jgi:hypothetical protein
MQRRLAMLVGAAGAAALLLAWVASAEPAPLWRDLDVGGPSPDGTPAPVVTGGAPGAVTTTSVAPPEPVDIGWLVEATLVLLAIAVIVAVIVWLSRRQWDRPTRRGPAFGALPEIAPEELLDAADEFEALIARGSARNAIVACWVRLEEAAEQAGLARNPAETPTEMTTRVLRAYAVDAASIGTLAALYREARFSTHDMHEGHRHEAQRALADIRRQLQATADVTAGSAAP